MRFTRPSRRALIWMASMPESSSDQRPAFDLRSLGMEISEMTQWAVFETNDDCLWSALRQQITSKLRAMHARGVLKGQTASDAYYVRCDRSTMTADDIAAG